jgi:hypothetical protein
LIVFSSHLSEILFSRFSRCSSSFLDFNSSIFRRSSLAWLESAGRAERAEEGAGTGVVAAAGAENDVGDSGTI